MALTITNVNKYLSILSFCILLTVFFLYKKSFIDDIPSCDGYVANVYTYTFLALLITCFCILFIAKRRYPITSTKSILAFAVAIFALFLMSMVAPRSILINHVLWLIFIIAVSASLYTLWSGKSRNVINTTLITTTVIVLLCTFIAYYYPQLIKMSWGTSLVSLLTIGLLVFVISSVSGFSLTGSQKIWSVFFTGLFIMFLLYDTKYLRIKSEHCYASGIPNYPKDSLNLFLDVINLSNAINM